MDFFFPGISLFQLAGVATAAVLASIVGGIAGYGTGLLLPLVLVPVIGPEPVVPVMAVAALLINLSRLAAFRQAIDPRRTMIVLLTGAPACAVGAWFYTRLSASGVQLLLGVFLVASVPLRRLLKRRGLELRAGGLALAGAGFGAITGTVPGTGVILISMLLASGLSGASVIATDAAISAAMHLVQGAVFGAAGVIDAGIIAMAVLIGAFSVPGAFIARRVVDRLPARIHTAVLDAVVFVGGLVMIVAALVH